MITATSNADNANVEPILPKSPTSVSAGQLWLDRHPGRNKRVILVLNTGKKCVVCQSISTGKITSVRKEQFNRGRSGFVYGGPVIRFGKPIIASMCDMLKNRFGDYLAEITGIRPSTEFKKNSQ
jgi:hypothetical protein